MSDLFKTDYWLFMSDEEREIYENLNVLLIKNADWENPTSDVTLTHIVLYILKVDISQLPQKKLSLKRVNQIEKEYFELMRKILKQQLNNVKYDYFNPDEELINESFWDEEYVIVLNINNMSFSSFEFISYVLSNKFVLILARLKSTLVISS